VSETATTETTEPTGEDHTLTDVKPGSLAYLHGYVPVLTLTDEGDGSVEVYHLGDQAFVAKTDLASKRGPRPSSLAPEAPQAGDRIASLEAQVAALLAIVSDKQDSTSKASGGSGDETEAMPAVEPTTSPFGT
jgi:hypothetical protein